VRTGTMVFGRFVLGVRVAKGTLLAAVFTAFFSFSCINGEGEWGDDDDGSTSGNLNLADRLREIHANAVSGGQYDIELTGSGNIGAQELSFSGRTNITIRITGSGGVVRTVAMTGSGTLFTIGSGVILELGDMVTLRGNVDNNVPLVVVGSGGTLTMKAGSKIISNTNRSGYSTAGVVVSTGGIFLMEGGEISGHTASGYTSRGGVHVQSGADFLMEGGKISGNTASSYGNGGGVFVEGRFTMAGGEISGNSVSSNGGGVHVSRGVFAMEGGSISGNTAGSNGGGVYMSNAMFTMSGGILSFNTAASGGGGVYVTSNAGIVKTGGTIYGYDLRDSNRNTATTGISSNDRGHAVFVDSSPGKRRETTAGPAVNLDSEVLGAAGGWE